MAQRSRDKAQILVRKEANGSLSPVGMVDVETIDAIPPGTEFELRRITKRSNLQLRLYWATLSDVLRRVGTDTWPSSEHLSEALKQALGYITTYYKLDGTPYIATDSIAFEAMTQEEFQGYFNAAMAKLTETVGFDVLAAYEEWARENRRRG